MNTATTSHYLSEITRELKQLRQSLERVEQDLSRVLTEHPYIVRIPGVKGGEPIIKDKGVTVRTVIALKRQGVTPEQMVDDYDGVLTLAEIYDALSFYYDHQEEIERYLAEHRAALTLAE